MPIGDVEFAALKRGDETVDHTRTLRRGELAVGRDAAQRVSEARRRGLPQPELDATERRCLDLFLSAETAERKLEVEV